MITRVVGVTFKSEEYGVNRQSVIKKLSGRENIFIRREPDNKHDPHAVAVLLRRKKRPFKLGYLKSEIAFLMSDLWEDYKFKARIHEIRSGDEDLDKPYGLSIRVTKKRKHHGEAS